MLTALRKFTKDNATLEFFYDEIEDSSEYTEGTVVCSYLTNDKKTKIDIEVVGEMKEDEDGELVDNNWFEVILYEPVEDKPNTYTFVISEVVDEDICSMTDEQLFDYLANIFNEKDIFKD